MGVLAHIFENAGLPTTQISLIRFHTEHIRPPRALWVPFILGRPLGQPGDADFQLRVLRSTLGLLDEPAGPVLVDHDEDAEGSIELDGTSCPINWARVAHDGGLRARLHDELDALGTWYALAVDRQQRTAFGTAGRTIEDVADAIVLLAEGGAPPADRPLGEHARLLAEDLKAFVTEAASAQPGTMSAFALKAWFWEQTVAGEALLAAYRAAAAHPDENYRSLAHVMIPAELR